MHIGHGGNSADFLGEAKTREGFAKLAPRGLLFETWCFHTQLEHVISLARAFPQATIILNHTGTPLAAAGTPEEVYASWRASIETLSRLPNMHIKLGGLAMPFSGVDKPPPGEAMCSEVLARLWRPYIEPCIEWFGAERCMFESNFPVDKLGCGYAMLWNAFKRVTAGASDGEKAALFAGTARRVYRLSV